MEKERKEEIHKFADFAEETTLDGKKRKLSEILNQEIVVTGQIITHSTKNSGECLKLQYRMNDRLYVTFTCSQVLIKQIKKYADQIPFVTTIKQVGMYYSFT